MVPRWSLEASQWRCRIARASNNKWYGKSIRELADEEQIMEQD